MREPLRLLPEHQALFSAAGLMNEAVGREHFRAALQQVTDWDNLLHLSLQHGIFPLFYRRLADFCPEVAPADFLTQARGIFQANVQRNLQLTGELLKILALFEAHDIAAVPLKGPVLAVMAYGDIALRQIIDLDILVSRDRLDEAKDLLISFGYRLYRLFTLKQAQVQVNKFYDFMFVHPQKVKLDLHWRLLNHQGGGPDAEAALKRRVPVTIEGKTVFSLAPEDMLSFLCLHAAFHYWSKLSYLADLTWLIQSQGPWDWANLIETAKAQGIERRLLLGLSLAGELLRVPVPQAVLTRAESDCSILLLRGRILKRLLETPGEEPDFLGKNWFHLKARERLRDKLVFGWSRVAIPNEDDWRWFALPDHFYWLYFAIRPLRLMTQYLILPLWRRLLRQNSS